MKITFNSKENVSLSKKEREKILSLLQGLDDIGLSVSEEPRGSIDKSESSSSLNIELLLSNLTNLQNDALGLEEAVSFLKERNDYLEGKIDWLRGKAGESDFKSPQLKHGSNFLAGNESIQSALVQVINKLESKAGEKTGLSFTKSKRVKKDKALISKSEYFDKEYVASQLKQLGFKVKDPLEFFVSFAAVLELSPSEKFDTKSYLVMNPDVKNSGINPLLHYIKHGKAEGRVLV